MSAQICPLMHLAIGANLLEQLAGGECTREVANNARNAIDLVTRLVKTDIELDEAKKEVRRDRRLSGSRRTVSLDRVNAAEAHRSELLACFMGGAI